MANIRQYRKFRAFLWTVAFTVGVVARGMAADVPNEYDLKAVMLFNLARFVQWPANAFTDGNSPIVIGVLGRNPFGSALENAVRGEKINGRYIVVAHFERLQALTPCHILFVCSNEKSRVGQVLARIKGQPILSVSEIDDFSTLPGGMVRFYTNAQKKIRLRLNLESARSAGLNVSSKLIQVAELEKTSLLWPRPPRMPGTEISAQTLYRPIPAFDR